MAYQDVISTTLITTAQRTTHIAALVVGIELPHAIMFPTAVKHRDTTKQLLEPGLRLLCLLAKNLDGPEFTLFEQAEEEIEQVVSWHTRHALELALRRLLLDLLQRV